MNVGALPELILSWLKNQGADLLQPGKDQPIANLKPGMQVDAKVLDLLPEGRNLVQIGNQALDMALPQQARPGDVIRLTFLNATPRPTFALSSTPAATSATPVSVSQAAQQVNALVRYVPVTASAPLSASTVAASVSTTATAANVSAQNSSAQGITAQSSSAQAARPILANPAVLLAPAPANSASVSVLPGAFLPSVSMQGKEINGMNASLGSQSSLASAQAVVSEKAAPTYILPMRLQQTVKESGLFYESHLGKWVRGEMSLESIQREPQARLVDTPGHLLNLPDLEGMPDQAARLASRQLNMLEGGPFVWTGQAWPGQNAEWTVQERQPDGNESMADFQKWHSNLRLTLPRMGEVAADLDIGALGLRIRLRSASAETLAEINVAMPELVQRMRNAELNLTSLQAEQSDAG